ncbi:MAG: DUF167 domain-containing protein [Candidatus Lokiarchaeia archaeon]
MADINVVEECEGGVLVRVFVKPGSSRLRCPAGVEDGFVIVEVRSPPVGGKANRELVKALAKLLGVSSGKVTIVKGVKDRNKIVKVLGVPVEFTKEKLGIEPF